MRTPGRSPLLTDIGTELSRSASRSAINTNSSFQFHFRSSSKNGEMSSSIDAVVGSDQREQALGETCHKTDSDRSG